MNLSTLERVKAATGNAEIDANDALLAQLLVGVSRRMEQRMCRHAQLVERTEVLEVGSGNYKVSLRGWPLTAGSEFELKASTTDDFASGESVVYVAGTDYVVNRQNGLIHLLRLPATKSAGILGTPIAPAFLQVRYTGGLAVDADGLIAAYPDLADACDLQVAHRFQRKDSAGRTSEKSGGLTGEAEHSGEYALLAEVREVCDWYRPTVFA